VNIAHVIESMEVGGAEVLVATLCRLQRERGHDVAVHCLSRSGPLAAQLERQGIPVQVHSGLSNWRQVSSLRSSFRKTNRQVIHCHNVGATIYGAIAGKLARAGAILTTRHGSISPTGKRRLLSALAGCLCDYVIAVGEPTRRVLVAESGAVPRKIVTVRNGAAPARVAPDSAARPGKKGFTAIMVARLAPPKDPATLLRALALALQQVPDLHLWIVGDGVLMPELRTLTSELDIEKHVTLWGQREDVGTYLAAADVFVLPSCSEGVPVSLLEAMAARLPFIVSNVGGMPEIAELSGAGIAVQARDPEALCRALVQYAERREDLPTLGNAARQCYEEHFAPERWADTYQQLYEKVLARKRACEEPAAVRSPNTVGANYK